MSKALRWSEKWFRRGLWLLAFVFAWFLIGLGSTIVGDLPQVEQQRTLDDFLDPQRAPALKAAIREADRSERDLQAELEQALAELRVEFPGLQPASENKSANLRYASFDAGLRFSALALTSYQGHYCRIRLTLASSAIGQDFQCLMDSLSAMLSHFNPRS